MKNGLLLLFVLSYFYQPILSQSDTVRFAGFPAYSVGWTASSMANLQDGVQISQEVGLTKKLALISEFGVIENEQSLYISEYGYLMKLGLQKIYKHQQDRFFTIGINYVSRAFDTEEVRTVKGTNIFSRDISQVNLEGLELTHGIHYRILDVFTIECGYGIGVGQRSKIVHQDNFDTSRTFDTISEEDWTEKKIAPILNFHLTISYALIM